MVNKHICPQFRRDNIEILDGIWSFRFDKNKIGDNKKYYEGFDNEFDIRVPFSYTCKESGINRQEQVDIIWYQRYININKEDLSKDVYLNFEGVDDICTIFLNGKFVGQHRGGNVSFKVLLNYALKEGQNLLVIKCEDDYSISKARGKQRWQDYNYGCWYVHTNGIYKSLYLERVNHTHLDKFKLTTNMDEANAYFDYVINNFKKDLMLELKISLKGQLIRHITQNINFDSGRIVIDLNSPKLDYQVTFWAPHDVNLYDLEITLKEKDEVIDYVESYFGISEYKVSEDNVLLNGFSYISKMVLYQGYSKDALLTPKNDEEIINDINNIKAMGFNGIRCHQYIPSERFLYLCDLLGLFVWIEYPSQHLFNLKSQDIILNEWRQILEQKYNHPSVFAFVIYNESWGIRGIKSNREQIDFVEALYHLTKSYVNYKPVISNDGWEHVKSDILTLHNYDQNAETLERFYKGENHLIGRRDNFVKDHSKEGLPVFLSEYGGTSIGKLNDQNGEWGYGNGVHDLEEFYERFASLHQMMKNIGFKGYCYTQYRDVEQEKNGLADEEGNLKVDPKRIEKIIKNIY